MIEIKEILYDRYTRVGPAPVLKKMGVNNYGGECTPFVRNGRMMRVETVNVGDPYSPDFYCYCQVRDVAENKVYPPFGKGHNFYSAYEEDGTVYVFCTNGSRGCWIIMFWSDDLIHWQEKTIIRREGWTFYNTSVCKGRDGKYVCAIEVMLPREIAGVPFTIFFATSSDLMNWTMMDDEIHYSDKRYTACPALRYLPSDDYYYMICLEALPLLRYAPYIYRTKDFMTWEIGLHNPVLWISEDDRRIMDGCSFPKEDEELIHTYMNINNCDIDLCEFEGKTYVDYLTGNQLGTNFACLAVYDGTMEQFLQHHFNAL